jgi:hypothetical protein
MANYDIYKHIDGSEYVLIIRSGLETEIIGFYDSIEEMISENSAVGEQYGGIENREYINLAVKGDRVGALKNIMTSLGNINPASKFI